VPEDAAAVADVLTAAGIAAWGAFLGAEHIETATRGAEQPADLVAVDAEGVLGFVAWDAATGEILRLYTHPRAGVAAPRGRCSTARWTRCARPVAGGRG
jgi:hypothetical protein